MVKSNVRHDFNSKRATLRRKRGRCLTTKTCGLRTRTPCHREDLGVHKWNLEKKMIKEHKICQTMRDLQNSLRGKDPLQTYQGPMDPSMPGYAEMKRLSKKPIDEDSLSLQLRTALKMLLDPRYNYEVGESSRNTLERPVDPPAAESDPQCDVEMLSVSLERSMNIIENYPCKKQGSPTP